MMKGNENGPKQSENDENGTEGINKADLPPEVAKLLLTGENRFSSGKQQQPPGFRNRSFNQYPSYNPVQPIHSSSPSSSLEDFVFKYVNSVNAREKGTAHAQEESTPPKENKVQQKEVEKKKSSPLPYRPPIPFSSRVLKEKHDEKYNA
ncbi:hypothetical protein M9H77_06746 [Catharanthus roseus]|uniref:Uncharacterized protein n=1 Tax=Catharanthus roseus TaxID=4058 RepID=A0ACC0BSZ4_CATRO|nr:hypothetical protein M9H77_06746 [Catharanthus roseus]